MSKHDLLYIICLNNLRIYYVHLLVHDHFAAIISTHHLYKYYIINYINQWKNQKYCHRLNKAEHLIPKLVKSVINCYFVQSCGP
jgi:hypothetical protein